MAEIIRSHETRIRQLEEQITGHPTDLSATTEEMNQLLRELPGVHFPVPDPNYDQEDEQLNAIVENVLPTWHKSQPDL